MVLVAQCKVRLQISLYLHQCDKLMLAPAGMPCMTRTTQARCRYCNHNSFIQNIGSMASNVSGQAGLSYTSVATQWKCQQGICISLTKHAMTTLLKAHVKVMALHMSQSDRRTVCRNRVCMYLCHYFQGLRDCAGGINTHTHDMLSPTIRSSLALIISKFTCNDAGESSLRCVMQKEHEDAACYSTYQIELG